MDSSRFEELVLLAKELEPREAEEALREAMSLWKGRPFDGVRYSDFAQPDEGV